MAKKTLAERIEERIDEINNQQSKYIRIIIKLRAELHTTKRNLSDCLKQNEKQEAELKDLREYRDNNEGIPKKWRRRHA
jgi:chromosome segregation ATPase